MQYSGQLRLCSTNPELTAKQYAEAESDISYTLLHDVILLEARSFAMKYQAGKEREEIKKKEEIESEIDRLQNSDKENDIERVNVLKEEVQKMEDERDMESARRFLAKYQLEGEKPTNFFCSINKKRKEKSHFEELHIREEDENEKEKIRIVKEQKSVEWEVRKYYWKLYNKEESFCSKRKILESIGNVKEVSEDDRTNLEKNITLEEVSNTLKNTRNNVAPGAGGFGGSFYKVFWKYLKFIVLKNIQEIFQKQELPLSLRLGVIALIPEGDKDQRYISNWRPLTLLDTLYKLIFSTLAARLKPTLDKILGKEQKAYVPGRYIPECTRNTFDIFTYAKKL